MSSPELRPLAKLFAGGDGVISFADSLPSVKPLTLRTPWPSFLTTPELGLIARRRSQYCASAQIGDGAVAERSCGSIAIVVATPRIANPDP